MLRTLACVTGAVALVCAGAIALPAPAQAESCPSEQQVLKSSAAEKGYTCANQEYTGHRKLSPWATYVFLADASYQYGEVYSCSGRDNKNIEIIKAKVADFQISFTATNWDISSHHWWAGSLFAVQKSPGGVPDSDSYVRSCGNDDGKIPATFLGKTTLRLDAPTSGATVGVPFTLTGTISPGSYGSIDGTKIGIFPVGSSTPVGQGVLNGGTYTATILPKVAIDGWALEAKYGGSSNTTPATSDPVYLNVSAPAVPTSQTRSISTHVSRADSGPVVALTKRSDDPRRLRLTCAPGSAPVLGTLMAERSVPSDAVVYGDNGVRVRGDVVAGPMTLQLLCRSTSAGVSKGNLRAGSIRPDTFATTAKGSTLLGGLGGDTLTVEHRGGTAFGGVGGDTITVTQRGVGVGGPGRDSLVSQTSGAVLEGGPGRDRFQGSMGSTFINARDGKSGDRITCLSSANKVFADAGDVISGPCTVM